MEMDKKYKSIFVKLDNNFLTWKHNGINPRIEMEMNNLAQSLILIVIIVMPLYT